MSEQQIVEATETEAAAQTEHVTLPDDHPLVRTLAEQKKAIKELRTKASRLDEIEEAQKSESERAAERTAKAEQRAVEAEAKALRREIALDHRLSKEDAELLDTLTDEDAIRRLAERLAAASEDKRTNGNVVPTEGTRPSTTSDPKRNFLREIRGDE